MKYGSSCIPQNFLCIRLSVFLMLYLCQHCASFLTSQCFKNVQQLLLLPSQLKEKFVNIRNRLSDLSKCRAIILGQEYDLKHVNDILHAIEKRQELWRYCDASSHTIREWQQTVFKKVTLAAFIHNAQLS